MIHSDFHTHTIYCDGKSTPEEIVLAAISKGMTDIGFSGHAHMSFDKEWCMSLDGTDQYISDIEKLREKYAGKIRIYHGAEYDYYSDMPDSRFEYIIGSVHYVEHNGIRRSVDDSPESFIALVDELYNGDYLACAEDYFDSVGNVVSKIGADIIGHFDLVTKFNESDKLFDTSCDRYRAAWQAAADKLLMTDRLLEINTGAISRGYRSKPYPSAEIIDYIGSRGGSFILSSDSHSANTLMYDFDEWENYVLSHGYKLVKSPIGRN